MYICVLSNTVQNIRIYICILYLLVRQYYLHSVLNIFVHYHFADHAELVELCCFWLGSNMLPPRSQMMYVSFDKGNNVFPMAESCFYSLMLPAKHAGFEEFIEFMDKALKYGSNGFCFM